MNTLDSYDIIADAIKVATDYLAYAPEPITRPRCVVCEDSFLTIEDVDATCRQCRLEGRA